MHEMTPARLKPGVSLDLLPSQTAAHADDHAEPRIIRGKALIFWDPALPGTRYGRKRDAIDTDQITPAADCVSESLETLDERWKAGAFRYLMPDFRARVHRGETFVVAGDRFAIGSSREMSPAGLKGIAEEAGLEMVIVCGNNMGDIFRRNALNLGLHVVQSPDAVADARDGDEFLFEPATRRLENLTQGKAYDPIPLTPKEDEIRRSGGIVAVGRRELRASVVRPPVVAFPDESRARSMTTTEQIVWAHRVDKERDDLHPGDTVRVYADLLPASDGTAPFAIHTFNLITGGTLIDPRQAAIANDHFVFTGRTDDERQTSIGRAFAKEHGLEKPYYATPGDGIFHFYFPEQGLVLPGQFIPGADSHSRAYGAYGAVGIGVGSTTLGFGWSTGYVYFTVPEARRVVFSGVLQPWVSGKDIVLELLRRWGVQQAQRMSVEFVDVNRQLPVAYRNTIANMMAEAEAMNGVFAADATTYEWYAAKGISAFPYPRLTPGTAAHYAIDEELSLLEVRPMIAKPFAPGNAYPAEDVARERIQFDKALIGSCTNGSYDDLMQAALVLYHARPGRRPKDRTALRRLPRLGRGRPADRAAGPAPGQPVDRGSVPIGRRRNPPILVRPLLRPGARRAHSRSARDHVVQPQLAESHGPRRRGLPGEPGGRRGIGAAGVHGPPSELGLRWDPETYGI